jgi:hypothetical protein
MHPLGRVAHAPEVVGQSLEPALGNRLLHLAHEALDGDEGRPQVVGCRVDEALQLGVLAGERLGQGLALTLVLLAAGHVAVDAENHLPAREPDETRGHVDGRRSR